MFLDTVFPVPDSAAPSLRVVIFYSDITSADRALRSVRDALRREQDERILDPMLWNIALLDQSQWLRLAAADVAQADLCVLSLSAGDERANDTSVWLRELAPRLARHWITLAPFEHDSAGAALRQAG